MPTFKPSRRIYSSYNSTLMTEQTNIKWGLYQRDCFQEGQKDFPVKCRGSPSVLFCFIFTVINSYPLSYRVFSPPCDLRCKVKQPFVRIIPKGKTQYVLRNGGFVHTLGLLGNWQLNGILLVESIANFVLTSIRRSYLVCLLKMDDFVLVLDSQETALR